MSKIFFTSDTHFGSDRVRDLSRRPFKTVAEMDNTIINNWNSVVEKDDIVYHLGDFGDYSRAEELNGRIKLFSGNYEMDSLGYSIDEFAKAFKPFNDNIINEVVNKCDKLKRKFNFNQVLYTLANCPFDITIEGLGKVSITHRPEDCNKDLFCLFGHIHKLQMVKKFGLNVGIDCHNSYPISLDDVLFYKNSIEKVYDDNVFMN